MTARSRSRSRSRSHRLAATAIGGLLLLAACGGGSDGDVGRGADEPTTAGAPVGDAGGAEVAERIGGEGASEALASVGLENKGEALVSAADAERFEIVGGVLHLYLGDGARLPAGTECVVVGSILTEGEQAVMHRADGTEVDC